MPVRDSVSWGTLLVGYTQVGRCNEGIQLFDEMLDLGVRPDNVALVGAISASAQLGMLDKGMAIHDHIRRTGILPNVFLSTGLVDLYAKCGCIGIAMDIFESSHDKNIFTWNAMIASLAMHGHGQRSLKLFMKMQDVGIRPDGVAFLVVLVGCSHVGLVEHARQLFDEMENIYNVHRGLSHYGCMADLLGRAGLIEEAVEMIESMPMEGDVYVWGGLLGGCGIHGNVEVAEIAAGHLMELTLDVGGTYSIMVNIYSKARMWKDVARMRRLMYVRRVRKSLGCSWIQVDGVDHEFVAGERWHPQIDEIC
ncbi:pentatricopeptide repeat-containing protein At5g61800-like isoform X1 [Magnolia sinica]|uniref:pentatricopeptide repeat-containing protein At5g61800-like isoform X1 n=1 Tax=Magnolia sinica TaxID=86752 RepID=UPI002658488C|nr:pentatricopeptide repeat-containing protein At5g61800-like isoform X1 [Magnolia sinica]